MTDAEKTVELALSIEKLPSEDRLKILNPLLKHLFSAVVDEDTLFMRNGKIYTGGNRNGTDPVTQGDNWDGGDALTVGEVNNLVSNAKSIQEMDLWRYLTDEMEYIAQRMMFENAASLDTIIFGKATLYVTDIMKKKVRSLAKFTLPPTAKEKK